MVAIEYRQKSSSTTAATTTTTATTTSNSNRNNNINNNTVTVLSPTSPSASSAISTATTTSTTSSSSGLQQQQQSQPEQAQQQDQQSKELGAKKKSYKLSKYNHTKMSQPNAEESVELMKRSVGSAGAVIVKSAVSQRNIDIKIEDTSDVESAQQELTKKVLKLDLSGTACAGAGGSDLDEYSLKSPKSPIIARLPHQSSLTSSVDVEDRKTLRDALYQGIFHRHRRTIFAVGSFLRMLRTRNSQYNVIRSSSETEDVEEVR